MYHISEEIFAVGTSLLVSFLYIQVPILINNTFQITGIFINIILIIFYHTRKHMFSRKIINTILIGHLTFTLLETNNIEMQII